ncbi:unnamed protein product [Rotaria magnacalcarata]|uniref:Uncharacterized protein n=1 Tax=Rotaria magnacalcarata TaxID=392030 RepID=A0A816XED0_9BILA|nr:unnamed protein product [Rotaria magnacalcarata]
MHVGIYLGFLLAVAYSSSIDGLSSWVGTASSAYLKDFVETHITDGTATIFCGILPLTLPDSNPFNRKHDWKYESIAKWTPLAQSMSWDSILLLGAGLTIATAFEVTSSGIHPAFLIFPCTLAVSLVFMLPIATPPSAIVFASGAIRVIDMIKTGTVMNLVGFPVIFIGANTWMPKIFDINEQTTTYFFNITSVVRSSVDNL